MMDPVSMTLAATQLLGAVNQVIKICAKYHEEMNKTPRDLNQLTDELKRLREVLEHLDNLIVKAKTSNDANNVELQALIPLYEPLTLYLEDIKSIQEKLAFPAWYKQTTRRRRSLAVALGWPLKEDEAKKELEKMKSFRQQLRDAIQVDHIRIAVENRKILANNQRLLTELVKSWGTQHTVDHHRGVNKWLATPDPQFNYAAALRKRDDATGSWFTQSKQFKAWLEDEKSFLWLYEIVGCGKTILTTTAIEATTMHCKARNGCATAYFYFDFNDKDKRLYSKMVRSILKQLSAQSPEMPRPLAQLYSSCEDMDRQPSIEELIDVLRQIIPIFYDFKAWNFINLHVLASSRPERLIQEEMDQMLDGTASRMHIQGHLIEQDIRIYIHGRLENDTKLKLWKSKPEVRNEIESKLMQRADGMFRLVVCHLDELTKCFTKPKLKEALNSLPATLDSMYASILARIPEEDEKNVAKTLRWLAHSIRPLRIEEVAEALTVDTADEVRFDPNRRFADAQDIFEICPSLIISSPIGPEDTESANRGDQIQLAHFSVKEFLVTDRAEGLAPRYMINTVDAHIAMAEDCLAYLLSLDDPEALNPDTFEELALVEYASKYWLSHAQRGNYGGNVVPLMQELFQDSNQAYWNWLSIYNPDRPWQGPISLARGEPLTKPQFQPSPLYIASLCGLHDIVPDLLEDGAEIDEPNGECGNALQAACRHGHELVVRQLLDAGAPIDAKSGLYGCALQAASFHGHEHVVQFLLNNGADAILSGGKYANAIHAASREGHLNVVRILLQAGAVPSATGGFYGFPLQAAAFYGHDQIVKCLIEGGANVDQVGGVYGVAIQAASRNGNLQTVRILLEAGASVNVGNGVYGTALQAAARGPHPRVVDQLLEAGADVNLQAGKYGNALQAACLTSDDQLVQRLLDAGAKVNANGSGIYGNALQAACVNGNEKIVAVLLKADADVNLKGGHHDHAVLAAAENGHDAALKLLLNAGADVKKWKIYLKPTTAGHHRVISLLQGAGAEIVTRKSEEFEGRSRAQGSTGSLESVAEADDSADAGRRAALTLKFCDECGDGIPNGELFYHCRICIDDDWDSCQKCVTAGFPCRDRTHVLIKQRMNKGSIVEVEEEDLSSRLGGLDV